MNALPRAFLRSVPATCSLAFCSIFSLNLISTLCMNAHLGFGAGAKETEGIVLPLTKASREDTIGPASRCHERYGWRAIQQSPVFRDCSCATASTTPCTLASQDQHQKAPAGRQADVAPMRGAWNWARGAVRMGRRLCCGGRAASSCRACCWGRADHLPAQCSATLTASMGSQTTARSTRISINIYQLSHTVQTTVKTWFPTFY